ncbi:MAG TPA: hypothetical protein VGL75_11495 [Acidothermaceae bacterium]
MKPTEAPVAPAGLLTAGPLETGVLTAELDDAALALVAAEAVGLAAVVAAGAEVEAVDEAFVLLLHPTRAAAPRSTTVTPAAPARELRVHDLMSCPVLLRVGMSRNHSFDVRWCRSREPRGRWL